MDGAVFTFEPVPTLKLTTRRIARLCAFCAAALALAVPATARAACTIDATGAVAFGLYDPTSATPADSTGTITYTCTSAALVTLSTGGSATFNPRRMSAGANTLNYNLYADAARTQIWGDFTAGTTIRFAAAGSSVAMSVYGRVPSLQNVNAGSYIDTVTVTFFF
jgi:spore coat protein U-like protein